jgi:tetratricopeptide (TPR) repeat protein
MITYGSSTERQDRLGEILIAQGKLSRADHKKFWEQSQSENCLLGITLVVNGLITLNDLYQGVTAQVVTILDRLQKWRTGDYEFEEGREPDTGTVLLRIPLALYLGTDLEKKPAAAAAPEKCGPAAASEGERASEPGGEEAGADEAISPEEAQELGRVGEVSFMVQELRKRFGLDAYAVLGVLPGASRPVVEAAYSRIAAVLGPGRLPEGCTAKLTREAEEVFRQVTAAFRVADDALRRREALAQAAPVVQRVRQAPAEEDPSRRLFAQGRKWFAERNYWQAADALRQAVRLKPDVATYRQYLGMALVQAKRLHEAEEHFVEATRLEPNNPVHFVNLGRVYRSVRLFKKAREAFERAQRLNPHDEQARDELRDLPEEPQPGRKAGGGILDKLFGSG